MTKVLPKQLGRYRPRDPFSVLIEAKAFWYPCAPMQEVEQPDLLAAPPIALVDPIGWAIPVDGVLTTARGRSVFRTPLAPRVALV